LIFYLLVRTMQCIYILVVDTISLNTVRGRLRPTMAISDVELSGSNLPETQSMQASSM
jgi:hypothetical protein